MNRVLRDLSNARAKTFFGSCSPKTDNRFRALSLTRPNGRVRLFKGKPFGRTTLDQSHLYDRSRTASDSGSEDGV